MRPTRCTGDLESEEMKDWIIVTLTACVVGASFWQAWFIRAQYQILKRQDNREQEAAIERLDIKPISGDSSAGVTVTNVGTRDVVVVDFAFEIGRLPSGRDSFPTSEIRFTPIKTDLATTGVCFPHRLQYGESFCVLIDRDKLVNLAAELGGESPVHMRPYCRDSLGNKHKPKHWTIYRDNFRTVYVGGPSPGRISEEELEELPRDQQKRYAQWSTRDV